MERLLHYVWKYRLFGATPLRTTDGLPVEVIDPGLPHGDAGPDFFNAKLRIGTTMWAGSVEIHEKASDWFAHHHETDRAYDSVILHVVGEADVTVGRPDGELIPQMILKVPELLTREVDWLLSRDGPLPCASSLSLLDGTMIRSWLDALLCERLERKVGDIFMLLDQYNEDWNEVFYILLCRNFGFGINSDVFERLARSLPLRFIRKQRASHSQVEALFFGQAGLLEETEGDHYYQLLRREYTFLRHKFDLKPLEPHLFKRLRTRPNNFPSVKLAQLAALWTRYDTLFSVLLEARSVGEIKRSLRVEPSDYWLTHYHFGRLSSKREKVISDRALTLFLINTVVPIFFAYGTRRKRPEYDERALSILERLPPEDNYIVSEFTRAGIQVRDASDTQALIQLRKAYCDTRKCLYCRFGHQLLRRTLPNKAED